MASTFRVASCLAMMIGCAGVGAAQTQVTAADTLRAGFENPPNSARPRVWWHWMNGNVTKNGIAKDLLWMQSVGIGGLQNFDVNHATPQLVDKRLVYMTPQWQEAFRYAVDLAAELGLEFSIASSPGWSETGAPWVKPRDGMKKLVWSETVIPGGTRFKGKIRVPPAVTGPFQDQPFVDELAFMSEHEDRQERPGFYADAVTLAVPIGSAGETTSELPIVTTASGRLIDARVLLDGARSTVAEVERGSASAPGEIRLSYPRPRTIRSATLALVGEASIFARPTLRPVLEAHVKGAWQRVARFSITGVPTTVSFAPVTARQFRIVLSPNDLISNAGAMEPMPGVAMQWPFADIETRGEDLPVTVADLVLRPDARVDRFETKAGFATEGDDFAPGAIADGAKGVAPDEVVDLTSKLKPDGSLDWTPPKGAWRVLRLGWSLTGRTNHPAIAEATGLEVDKFDGVAVRSYLETYLSKYKDAVGAELIGAKGIRALLTDSIEVGPSNWTPALVEKFKSLRGYDPVPWLAVLTGTLVGTRAESDAFLYDFRRTLSDLIATEHYGTIAKVANEHGLQVYGEALECGRSSPGDDLAMRRYADVPMAALWSWMRGTEPVPCLIADMKGAASVAHLYGRNVVAAESLTSALAPWAFAPADLRRFVDLEFSNGVNRPVIHTSVHQPLDDKVPGLSLSIFGQYFNRHEAWASMARPWVEYLSRNSYLLQQGRNFADVAYFYGEEQSLTALNKDALLADVPKRHAYDFVNADALASVLHVDSGDLVASSGARYRVLYLGGTSRRMTLTTLDRIAKLVESGATLVGDPPRDSPALGDDATKFRALVRRLWSGAKETKVGKGCTIAGNDVEAVLASLGIGPDFAYAAENSDAALEFAHRRIADGDIYFVSNRRNRAEKLEARFRVTGRRPELWRADTGKSEAASYRFVANETIMPLTFSADESYFVVFRGTTDITEATFVKPEESPIAEIVGPWNVAFQAGRGAPASATFARLQPLELNSQSGIRYFSGVATYTARFTLPKMRPGKSTWIDLGKVGDVAQVLVNGREVGMPWKAPYRVDVSKAAKQGVNELEVRVATTWVNRLIGDAQPGATKVTFTTTPTYKPDAPLRPSGLIGPVQLIAVGERGE